MRACVALPRQDAFGWGGGSDDWSFCHNDGAELDPWLSVQVADALVTSVIIHGRSDCRAEQLGTYQVWVGSAPGDPTSVGGMTRCQPTDTLTSDGTVGPFTVTCDLVGTYVTLLLPGSSRELMLDELVVMGEALLPSPPPASPPFASHAVLRSAVASASRQPAAAVASCRSRSASTRTRPAPHRTAPA